MATNTTATVIANSRTPASVVWLVGNPGIADAPTLAVPRATVLGLLLAGPLKALLAKVPNWTVFNVVTGGIHTDDVIRWTAIEGGYATPLVPPITTLVVLFQADAIEFSITRDDEGLTACNLLVEMRHVHSNER